MKVCIYALPRTSSTNLFHVISNLHNFNDNIREPFNTSINTRGSNVLDLTIKTTGNILVKQLFHDYVLPPGLNTLSELNVWVKNNFTHVICLYREDTLAQAESFLYRLNREIECDYTGEDRTDLWHRHEDLHLNTLSSILLNEDKELFDTNNILLKQFALDNGYPIVKYEDLILNEGDNVSFKNICEYISVVLKPEVVYSYYKKENKITNRIR